MTCLLNQSSDSQSHYTRHWKCIECTQWDNDIEAILTWKLVSPTLPDTPENRQYLLKFQDLSHLHCAWVPYTWLNSIPKEKTRLNAYHKKISLEIQESKHRLIKTKFPISESQAVNPEWKKADVILDVEYKDTKKKKSLSNIFQVFVKFKDLPFDVSSWELYPGTDSDFKQSVDDAYPLYLKGIEISTCKSSTQEYKFKEFKTQSDLLIGGTLKDYQLDGLKYL